MPAPVTGIDPWLPDTIDPTRRKRVSGHAKRCILGGPRRCGANVVMPNVGPTDYRPLYQIYLGKICVDEGAEKCKSCLGRMIIGLGRTVGQGPGHSPKPRFG